MRGDELGHHPRPPFPLLINRAPAGRSTEHRQAKRRVLVWSGQWPPTPHLHGGGAIGRAPLRARVEVGQPSCGCVDPVQGCRSATATGRPVIQQGEAGRTGRLPTDANTIHTTESALQRIAYEELVR